MPGVRPSLAVLAVLLAGCGPEVWTSEREVGRREESREETEFVLRLDPLLGAGGERRFSLEFERVWRVRGQRDIEVVEYSRPFNVFYESGEMLIGIVVTPFYVLLFPAFYPLSVGIQEEDASVGKYFAVIPERLLNPTRNDMIQEDVTERVASRRSEPFEDRFVEDLSPEAKAALSIEFVRLSASIAGTRADLPGVRFEQGIFVFPAPTQPVDEYELAVRVDGVERAVRFEED